MNFFFSVTEHLNKTFLRTRGETPDGQPGNGNDRSSADGCGAGTQAQVSGQSLVTKRFSFVWPEQLPDGVLPARAAPCLPLQWATIKFPATASPVPGEAGARAAGTGVAGGGCLGLSPSLELPSLLA